DGLRERLRQATQVGSNLVVERGVLGLLGELGLPGTALDVLARLGPPGPGDTVALRPGPAATAVEPSPLAPLAEAVTGTRVTVPGTTAGPLVTAAETVTVAGTPARVAGPVARTLVTVAETVTRPFVPLPGAVAEPLVAGIAVTPATIPVTVALTAEAAFA